MKVLVWNVDQANREERYPETMWDKRTEAVKALIRKVNADIVCLVELRALKTSNETPEQFMAAFPEYANRSMPYNYYHDCFSMAVMWRKELLFALGTRVEILGTNMQTARAIMLTDFVVKATGARFTVGLTHFDLPEDVKWTSVKTLIDVFARQLNPTFIYGDYNFFDDRDGLAQREEVLTYVGDLAAPLPHGTFVGFPHDEFKKRAGEYSRLDHVFARKICAGPPSFPFLGDYSLDNSSYATYTYPSDHLAISFELML